MATTALIIGATERKAIAALCGFAAANPMDVLGSIAAAAADVVGYRDMMRMHSLELPYGYCVTYSHEIHPSAPAPGLCQHISISVTRPGKMASPAAVEMILQEFGMRPLKGSESIWIEDIDAETKALNVVQVARD